MTNSGDQDLTGGCACGSVRYKLTSLPLLVHCCHCTNCQTETGSAFAVNALIEADRVTTTAGAAEPVLVPSASGRGQQIWRCPSCGVALWSNYGGKTDVLRFIRVGTLDNLTSLSPDVHIYTRSKVPWVRLPDDVLAVDEYYDLESTWPSASLDRYRAIFR